MPSIKSYYTAMILLAQLMEVSRAPTVLKMWAALSLHLTGLPQQEMCFSTHRAIQEVSTT